jgi:hypothetical protein
MNQMTKFVFILALLLAIAAVEKASAHPTYCPFEDGVPVCVDDDYFDGPA